MKKITLIVNQNENMMHDNVQTMTSLEIAELTGKQHKNVMQAIRKMEPGWEKVAGLKFQLSSRVYNLPNGGTKVVPYYSLTKDGVSVHCYEVQRRGTCQVGAAL